MELLFVDMDITIESANRDFTIIRLDNPGLMKSHFYRVSYILNNSAGSSINTGILSELKNSNDTKIRAINFNRYA